MPRAGLHNRRDDALRPGVRPASPRLLAAAAVVITGFAVIVISAAGGVLLA